MIADTQDASFFYLSVEFGRYQLPGAGFLIRNLIPRFRI